jgi:hypothetical protein
MISRLFEVRGAFDVDFGMVCCDTSLGNILWAKNKYVQDMSAFEMDLHRSDTSKLAGNVV